MPATDPTSFATNAEAAIAALGKLIDVRDAAERDAVADVMAAMLHGLAPDRPHWFTSDLRDALMHVVGGEDYDSEIECPRAFVRDDDLLVDVMSGSRLNYLDLTEDEVDLFISCLQQDGVCERLREMRGELHTSIAGYPVEQLIQGRLGGDDRLQLRAPAPVETPSPSMS